jgi:polygalacturonase
MKTRREFLQLAAMGGAFTAPAFLTDTADALLMEFGKSEVNPGWNRVPEILSRIKPPVFPNREFDITKFGAVPDNKTDNTTVFQRAIAACAAAGGGAIVVPSGEFLTGAIHLKSNVNLHVAAGGVVRFTSDTKSYPMVLTRFEGTELMNYSPFIYAFDEQNIAITGEGTLDGNASCETWWGWRASGVCSSGKTHDQRADRDLLVQMAEEGVPVAKRVFGPGHWLRPNFIQPYRCKNVLIEGVTLLHSPMWQVNPVLCKNVTVRRLKINADGPNTDGCDPECCSDVLIEDCEFNTGDDCIAIKSGRNADGRRIGVAAENIVIRNCHMKNGHGGVTIGSEISGGARNIFADKCEMSSPKLDSAIRIKNNAMRGGVVENIFVRDITVGEVGRAVVSIDFNYEEGKNGKFIPVAGNIEIERVQSQKSEYALYLRGFENAPVEDVRLVDCDFRGVEKPNVVENVKGLELRDVRINGNASETNRNLSS